MQVSAWWRITRLNFSYTYPSPNAVWENIFLLSLAAITKLVLTSWTFGMKVRSSWLIYFFVNTVKGTCGDLSPDHRDWSLLRTCSWTPSVSFFFLSRIRLRLKHRRQGLHRAYPDAWMFSACPPDPSVRCISPGFYSVIGASAMLGGVTRMTSKDTLNIL